MRRAPVHDLARSLVGRVGHGLARQPPVDAPSAPPVRPPRRLGDVVGAARVRGDETTRPDRRSPGVPMHGAGGRLCLAPPTTPGPPAPATGSPPRSPAGPP